MWERPFDPSMIDSGEPVIILCDTQEKYNALSVMLDQRGLCFVSGLSAATNVWVHFKENTCILLAKTSSVRRILFGRISDTEKLPDIYSKYTKCTFYLWDDGDLDAQADPAAELSDLIIGGVGNGSSGS